MCLRDDDDDDDNACSSSTGGAGIGFSGLTGRSGSLDSEDQLIEAYLTGARQGTDFNARSIRCRSIRKSRFPKGGGGGLGPWVTPGRRRREESDNRPTPPRSFYLFLPRSARPFRPSSVPRSRFRSGHAALPTASSTTPAGPVGTPESPWRERIPGPDRRVSEGTRHATEPVACRAAGNEGRAAAAAAASGLCARAAGGPSPPCGWPSPRSPLAPAPRHRRRA